LRGETSRRDGRLEAKRKTPLLHQKLGVSLLW